MVITIVDRGLKSSIHFRLACPGVARSEHPHRERVIPPTDGEVWEFISEVGQWARRDAARACAS